MVLGPLDLGRLRSLNFILSVENQENAGESEEHVGTALSRAEPCWKYALR